MKPIWTNFFPPAQWLAAYRAVWLRQDVIAGVTLAAYAIPVSLAYAALAGLPPQIGIYGYMLGGIGYALLGSSRQLAVGPTSAISLMIAGTVGALAAGDAVRYAQIASIAALAVAALCLIAWIFRLSMLVRLISDSILVGFKAGAGLTIIMTQLPSLFGVAGGGHNFFDRLVTLAGQLGGIHWIVLAIGLVAILLLLLGERLLPGRPVGLAVVHPVDPRCNAARLAGAGRSRHRRNPEGPAELCHARRSGCWSSTNCFRSQPASCCSPMSKAFRPREALRPSTAIRSTCGRSFWDWAPPISRYRWAMAIPSRAGCRNRRSTTRPARKRRWRSSSVRSRWRSACCSSRGS